MPDAKMKTEESSDKKTHKDEAAKVDDDDETPTAPPLPPLEAAARRLERMLGGSSASGAGSGSASGGISSLTFSNPAKVVRRWLGTASGAAGDATLDSIASAASILLDPKGYCAHGRTLLGADNTNVVSTMDVDTPSAASGVGDADAVDTDGAKPIKLGYLTSAADREVESWLLSLMIRLLWKDSKNTEAFDLSQKGIAILMTHLETSAQKITAASGVSATSLYPLLARMFRMRSLAAEQLEKVDPSLAAALRQDMARAHNMACLRRDFDCQATLLNLMLRDLLNNSQGRLKKYLYLRICLIA